MNHYEFIHLSDLHLGKTSVERRRIVTLFAHIAKHLPNRPVLITGDLTESAKDSQFKGMEQLVTSLAATNPVLCMPGNHDYAWHGFAFDSGAWDKWVKYLGSPMGWPSPEPGPWMGGALPTSPFEGLGFRQVGDCLLIGIDSGDPGNKVHTAKGYISQELANALRAYLDAHPAKVRIALLHHHPITWKSLFTGLVGRDRLIAALRDRCEVLLFGHHHEAGIWHDTDGIPLMCASHKSTDYISGRCLMYGLLTVDTGAEPPCNYRMVLAQ